VYYCLQGICLRTIRVAPVPSSRLASPSPWPLSPFLSVKPISSGLVFSQLFYWHSALYTKTSNPSDQAMARLSLCGHGPMALSTILKCAMLYWTVSLKVSSYHLFPTLTQHRLLADLHFYCNVDLACFVLPSYIAQDPTTSMALYHSSRALRLLCPLERFSCTR
jgi:hypothetical protein